jgi:hypothetical protein
MRVTPDADFEQVESRLLDFVPREDARAAKGSGL